MSSEFVPLAEVNDTTHDPPTPEEPPLDGRLLGHWALDGTEDDVTISGDDRWMKFIRAEDGRQALTYWLDQVGSSAEIPAFHVDNSSFTVCLWFCLGSECDILLLADNTNPRQFSISYQNNCLQVVLKGESGNDVLSIKGSEMPHQKWAHIAFVWDHDAKQGEIFVDGHSVAMGTSVCDKGCLAQVYVQRFVLACFLAIEQDEDQENDKDREWAEVSLDASLGPKRFSIVFECYSPDEDPPELLPRQLFSQSSADHDFRMILETNGLITVRLHITKNNLHATYTSKTKIGPHIQPVGFTWEPRLCKGVIYVKGEDDTGTLCTDSWADSLDDRSPRLFYLPSSLRKNILQSHLREQGREYYPWAQQRFDDLADSVEQFAVDFIGQTEGEGSLELVDKTIQQALFYEQKKEQWGNETGSLLVLFLIVLDSLLYPLLLVLFCSKRRYTAVYLRYTLVPLVCFTKDLVSQFTFIALHMAVCLSPSSVQPTAVEYVILVFFLGRILAEVQQYQRSRSKIYFRDMWNYLDITIILCYITIVIVRIVTMAKSGPVQGNNLLAGVMYMYGINTLFLILRVSSVLELNRTTGPLQLALMRMLVDLWVIIVQFVVVILAFSFAITKVYFAQRSLAMGQTETNATYSGFCPLDGGNCLRKTTESLVWSLFGLTDLDSIATNNRAASTLAYYLYAIFLVICVVMLLNTLVALLNNTYEDIKSNSDTEWKYVRAMYADQYNRCHPFPPPVNLITVPLSLLLDRLRRAACVKRMENSKYRIAIHFAKIILYAGQPPDHVHGEVFLKRKCTNLTRWALDLLYWENTKKRYLEKFGESFPDQDDNNIGKVHEEVVKTRDRITRSLALNLSDPTSQAEALRPAYTDQYSEGIASPRPSALPIQSKTWRTCGEMLVRNSLLMRAANAGPLDAHVDGCPIYGQGIPGDYAIAHNMTPLTKDNPSFEVYIKNAEDDIEISVGVVPENYPLCEPPGSIAGSVAYFARDSGIVMTGASLDKVYGVEQECEGDQLQRDDIIRCTLDFSEESSYGVPISFEVNQKCVWRGVVHFQRRVPASFYPRIAIGSPGLAVIYQGLGSYGSRPAATEPPGDTTGNPALKEQMDVKFHEMQEKFQEMQENFQDRMDRVERNIEALLEIARGRREAEPADK
ncbi:predicted protein [Nematostella vectensis]|uniref:Ion transport domain-containing protein n=1 Tax=Nematostella vectensis TaxID=45351 RepID=A7SYW3_NEMVE|nr:predicted protein [Nematostella vectensis]|eukprot:XP_001623200.1 predicted protein [Nematostella vectensis]